MTPGTAVVGYLDGGKWSACFGVSLRNLYIYDVAHEGRLFRGKMSEIRLLAGTGGIATGRNRMAAGFLDQTDAEWLWMVDSDMGFLPETLDRLIAAADPEQRPVVGALCFGQRNLHTRTDLGAERYAIQPMMFVLADVDGELGFAPLLHYERSAVMAVDATGAACVLIHRGALERLREKFGDEWFSPVTHPTGMKGAPRTYSEDLSFCVRLAMCDIPIHVDTSVHTTHEKNGIFLDEETYDQHRALVGS